MSFMPVSYTVWSQWAALGAKKGKNKIIAAILLQEGSLCLLILVKHFLFHGKQSNFSRRYLDCHHHYASTPQPGPYIDTSDRKWKTPLQETQRFMPSFCLKALNHVLPNSFYSKYQSEHLRAPDRILGVRGSEEGWVLAQSSRRIPHLGALWLTEWSATQQNWVWGHFHHGKEAAEVSGHPSQQQLPVTAACSWLPALATRIKLAFISDQPFDLICHHCHLGQCMGQQQWQTT